MAGAIYGVAPHGRLGTLRRPATTVRGVRGLWITGGTVHPGGGLPLVALGGALTARELRAEAHRAAARRRGCSRAAARTRRRS